MIIVPAEFNVLSSTMGHLLPDNNAVYKARECIGESLRNGFYEQRDAWMGKYVFGNDI